MIQRHLNNFKSYNKHYGRDYSVYLNGLPVCKHECNTKQVVESKGDKEQLCRFFSLSMNCSIVFKVIFDSRCFTLETVGKSVFKIKLGKSSNIFLIMA